MWYSIPMNDANLRPWLELPGALLEEIKAPNRGSVKCSGMSRPVNEAAGEIRVGMTTSDLSCSLASELPTCAGAKN